MHRRKVIIGRILIGWAVDLGEASALSTWGLFSLGLLVFPILETFQLPAWWSKSLILRVERRMRPLPSDYTSLLTQPLPDFQMEIPRPDSLASSQEDTI